MFKRKISAVLLAMAALGCASTGQSDGAQAHEIAIDQGAAGSTVALRQGQRLTVSLQGNPTTGFVWELAPGSESILSSQGEPRYTRSGAALGAGGVYLFAFQAVAPGSAPLRLVYHRPFEKGAAPARSFEVTVVIEK